jgi:RAD50-interacting protein 1
MPKLPPVKDAQFDGTVFDELIAQYASLLDRAEDIVAQHVYGEVEVELRAHLLA